MKQKKEPLILDGHKVSWHKERVDAWLRGERIAPIEIELAISKRCNYNCKFCYAKMQKVEEQKLTKEVLFNFLDDCAEIGVKSIAFIGDGESVCNPHIYDAIIHGKEKGLDMALGTNGSLLKIERLPEILPCLTYLRFSIAAGQPKRYAEIMGCREEDFHKVKKIIKECVRIKKEKNLRVTIGLQMVFMPDFIDQIMPLANFGKKLGVDYLVIKHCSDDEKGTLGVKYEEYFDDKIIKTLKKAEALSDDKYFVKAKWSKILSGGKRKYDRCYGPPFSLNLSGSGLVAPCGNMFNEQHKEFHIGNFAETRFKDIWKSEKYWKVMDLLASGKFDMKKYCGTLCFQHKVNEYLWDLKQGNVKLEKPKGEPPEHINFI